MVLKVSNYHQGEIMKTITHSEWTWIIKQAKKCEAEQRELINLINGRFQYNRMDPLIKIH